jgi:hypothetical protein
VSQIGSINVRFTADTRQAVVSSEGLRKTVRETTDRVTRDVSSVDTTAKSAFASVANSLRAASQAFQSVAQNATASTNQISNAVRQLQQDAGKAEAAASRIANASRPRNPSTGRFNVLFEDIEDRGGRPVNRRTGRFLSREDALSIDDFGSTRGGAISSQLGVAGSSLSRRDLFLIQQAEQGALGGRSLRDAAGSSGNASTIQQTTRAVREQSEAIGVLGQSATAQGTRLSAFFRLFGIGGAVLGVAAIGVRTLTRQLAEARAVYGQSFTETNRLAASFRSLGESLNAIVDPAAKAFDAITRGANSAIRAVTGTSTSLGDIFNAVTTGAAIAFNPRILFQQSSEGRLGDSDFTGAAREAELNSIDAFNRARVEGFEELERKIRDARRKGNEDEAALLELTIKRREELAKIAQQISEGQLDPNSSAASSRRQSAIDDFNRGVADIERNRAEREQAARTQIQIQGLLERAANERRYDDETAAARLEAEARLIQEIADANKEKDREIRAAKLATIQANYAAEIEAIEDAKDAKLKADAEASEERKKQIDEENRKRREEDRRFAASIASDRIAALRAGGEGSSSAAQRAEIEQSRIERLAQIEEQRGKRSEEQINAAIAAANDRFRSEIEGVQRAEFEASEAGKAEKRRNEEAKQDRERIAEVDRLAGEAARAAAQGNLELERRLRRDILDTLNQINNAKERSVRLDQIQAREVRDIATTARENVRDAIAVTRDPLAGVSATRVALSDILGVRSAATARQPARAAFQGAAGNQAFDQLGQTTQELLTAERRLLVQARRRARSQEERIRIDEEIGELNSRERIIAEEYNAERQRRVAAEREARQKQERETRANARVGEAGSLRAAEERQRRLGNTGAADRIGQRARTIEEQIAIANTRSPAGSRIIRGSSGGLISTKPLDLPESGAGTQPGRSSPAVAIDTAASSLSSASDRLANANANLAETVQSTFTKVADKLSEVASRVENIDQRLKRANIDGLTNTIEGR